VPHTLTRGTFGTELPRGGVSLRRGPDGLRRGVDRRFALTRRGAAQSALPYVHVKPERPPATDPAATATQIESESDTDPLAEAIKAFRRGDYDRGRIERPEAGSES
jgi:hypothetical protein